MCWGLFGKLPAKRDFTLPKTSGTISIIAGRGEARWNDNALRVKIPQPLDYLWLALA